MRALTVCAGVAGSAAVTEVQEPPEHDGSMLVETLAIGVCGTDHEILAGRYGTAPPGEDRLTIGHECIGRVRAAPASSGFVAGDLIVPIVRRPDPVPCRYCAVGEWDMCRNGRYTERGIKERHGFASDRFRIEPAFSVKVPATLRDVGMLVEPASVVAKAWDHVERIGGRSRGWRPARALVTGAGPVGLLAALLGHQRGLDVHVYDRVESGPKPQLVRALGATYHHGTLAGLRDLEPDVVIECTGATPVIADVLTQTGASGVVCLAGVSPVGRETSLDLGDVNRRIVLENDAIFGSVNANRSHYEMAAAALGDADPGWLRGLVTRRVPFDRWADAMRREPDDVKAVIDVAGRS